MTVQLNPQGFPASAGNGPRVSDRRREQEKQAQKGDKLPMPARATVNFIPAPESLSTLISNAVEALKRGIYWDRGTILNLLA